MSEVQATSTFPSIVFSRFLVAGSPWDLDRLEGPFYPIYLMSYREDWNPAAEAPDALVVVAWPLFPTPDWFREQQQEGVQDGPKNELGLTDYAALAQAQRDRAQRLEKERAVWGQQTLQQAAQQGALLIPFHLTDPQPGSDRMMTLNKGVEEVLAAMDTAASNSLMAPVLAELEEEDRQDLRATCYNEAYLSGAFYASGLSPNWAAWVAEQAEVRERAAAAAREVMSSSLAPEEYRTPKVADESTPS